MGYYTSYSLSIEEGDQRNLREAIKRLGMEDCISTESGDSLDSCKWYDHTDDTIEMSKFFPGTLFCLSGIGEEFGDWWKLYAKNGKGYKQFAEVKYLPYDESKLK